MTAVIDAAPHQNQFADKYAGEIPEAAVHELRAIFRLRCLGIYDADYAGPRRITPQGRRFPGRWATAGGDRFDLYSPMLGIWFEVSATDYTFEDSKKRYGTAKLAVLPSKVDEARKLGILNRLVFVSVNYNEGPNGEVRYMPAPHVIKYPLGFFAKGEGDYYLTEWRDWLHDRRLCEILSLEPPMPGEVSP